MSPRHVFFLKEQELCFVKEFFSLKYVSIHFFFGLTLGHQLLHIYKMAKGKNLQLYVGENAKLTF